MPPRTPQAHVRPFMPLAVGSPRSGFVLLTSVLAHFVPLARSKRTLGDLILKGLVEALGGHVADEVTGVFEAAGKGEDLIYNPNFRLMTGGPKWLRPDDEDRACFRKYIGVRGLGDFTLITSHPREVLDCDDIVHSHDAPGLWTAHEAYGDYRKFASVRNPVGIVNSSLFSLNALTSEYIQRFVPPEEDTHALRESLALYKYTDLDFFQGILDFYKGYFDEYLKVRDAYAEMRWEDLLTDPVRTITSLAGAAGLPVDEEHAGQIWAQIGHVNLTGAHKHNFRKGGGKPGDWKNWITNRHLDIMREAGFGAIMEELGYGPIEALDEDAYTPFQRRLAGLMDKGEVFENFPDKDLFGFAFNKSNLKSDKFGFNTYDWKETTRVERSSFADEALMMEAWEKADAATGRLNDLFRAALAEDFSGGEDAALAALSRIRDAAEPFAGRMPRAFEAVFPGLERLVRDDHAARQRGLPGFDGAPPRLIRSFGATNIVAYNGLFYGIPHSAGELDLTKDSVDGLPGVVSAPTYPAVIEELTSRS